MSFVVGENLYALDSKGKLRFWRAEVVGATYFTVSGLVDGQAVQTDPVVCKPKNTGKKNATTGEEQALKEAAALYQKKIDKKYHTDVANVGTQTTIEPMLATKFDVKKAQFPCYSQPKFDGIRLIATSKGLFSRTGKEFNIPHIREALAVLFIAEPDLILDGELYNHELRDDFNEIVSLVKDQPKDEQAEKVKYYIYDATLPNSVANFHTRNDILQTVYWPVVSDNLCLELVETQYCVDQSELDKMYDFYLENGYEGQMVRLTNSPYEFGKRSKDLQKRKEFLDEEFEIISVEEGKGNWAGYAKRVHIRLPDGRTCKSGIKGKREFAKKLLAEWEKYKFVTVRYFNLTPDGIPRFPVAVNWHESLENRD